MRYIEETAPGRRDASNSLWVAVVGVLLVFLLIVVGWLLVTLEASAIIMALPAMVPLAIVLGSAWWLDRWEPEPRLLLALGLVYGAGASVLGTLWGGNLMMRVTGKALELPIGEAIAISVQGPVVEEVMKGLGLLLILAIARREFDGPVDGFIYAAMIGAGFAFTENILYFANAGEESLVWTLVVRGILSPFAHALFTGLAGMALGWAARYGGMWRVAAGWVGGTVLAILAHAFWNTGSVLLLPLVGVDPSNPVAWIAFYVLVQIPLFCVIVWFLLHLRERDRRMTKARLEEYCEKGWFTPNEVAMITDWGSRVKALQWAKQGGDERHRAMRDFIEDATRLAYAREHARIDKRDPDRRRVERSLLNRVQEDRSRIQRAGTSATAIAAAATGQIPIIRQDEPTLRDEDQAPLTPA